jgi:hypothetical protein
VAGQDALAFSQEVGHAQGKDLWWDTNASSGQHILEAVSSLRGGALSGAPDRSRYCQRRDLVKRIVMARQLLK